MRGKVARVHRKWAEAKDLTPRAWRAKKRAWAGRSWRERAGALAQLKRETQAALRLRPVKEASP